MSIGNASPIPLLERLGLHRPELRAWAMYDWANSAMVTVIVTAVFPIYFSSVASRGLPPVLATSRFAAATTVGLVAIALASPLLGTIADLAGAKKRLMALSLAVGVLSVAAMWFVGPGDWVLAATLFVLANVGANASFVFYDALLPHVARQDELDRVSTAAYALGYIGGGLLLSLNLAWILRPAWFGLSGADPTIPARLAFLSVAAWWLVFSMPLFLRIREPPALAVGPVRPLAVTADAFRSLARTFRDLRAFPQATLMLVAFLVYNDGIGTIIRMATIYGTEIGLGQNALVAAVVLVQFVGVPFAFLFGALAGRIGAKRGVLLGLVAYAGISILGYVMRTTAHFFALAILVGMVQGGTQALSRSLFASMIPRHRSGEFFGFFAVTEKFAGILGPAVFAATATATGSSRSAVLAVIAFFVIGGALLSKVDVETGRRAARQAELGSDQPAARSAATGTPST